MSHSKITTFQRDNWIQQMIAQAQPIVVSPLEQKVMDQLIDVVDQHSATIEKNILLAAAFDLLMMVEYYRTVTQLGWLSCNEEGQLLLIYPYTNACPRCSLQNKFVYHKANKPKSGEIGAKTSRLLAAFLQSLFDKNHRLAKIRKEGEPVDVIVIDDSTSPTRVMFAEIKAAPLVTLPLAMASTLSTATTEELPQSSTHHAVDKNTFYGSELNLLLPIKDSPLIKGELVPLGIRHDKTDDEWAYRGLYELFSIQPQFFTNYFNFWKLSFECYRLKTQKDLFWLTNGCGQPSPRPSNWPSRESSSGYESISDSKSSVGMHRTDDLKKATYQVLKMNAEGKPSSKFDYKVGIISNIHSVRHFDDYLAPLQDVVWTRHESNQLAQAEDLPSSKPFFNLFDGIITFTQNEIRDEWLALIFNF